MHHLTQLANVILVNKKNGVIRACVHFRDLNKACLKNNFSLLNIYTLVDATTSHEIFSFMDRFSRYNHIKMAPSDVQKIAFKTPFDNFYYTIMPFEVKNASAIYQHVMTTIFHDMMHDCMKDYVDDIVVKSKKVLNHLGDFRRVFK